MMEPVKRSKIGDVEYFRSVDLEFLKSYRMPKYGDTCLSIAASDGQLEVCKVLYERYPHHLYSVNDYQNTIFHHVAFYCSSTNTMCQYFIDRLAEAAGDSETEFGFKQWLQKKNLDAETAFYRSLKSKHITEMIKYWIQVDRKYNLDLLGIPNKEGNTALHKFAALQNLEHVELLLTAEPDFEYGTNNDGELPLWIAMRLALSSGSSISADIRRLILERQPVQSSKRIGEKQWTALHHAAHICDVAGIGDIVRFCPSSMEIVDANGQNFLHTAAKFDQVELVKWVLETKNISAGILNALDNYGNTPFHIAAAVGNKKMMVCFLYDPRVNKMINNDKGQKGIDMITFEYDKEKAQVYGVRDRVNEKELKDQSDFDLVVGALIATVSFTVGVTVPGGYISDGPKKGMAVLSDSIPFQAFVISNNLALVLSLYAVFSHFCTRRLLKRADIVWQLNIATICTLSAIFAMMIAFITGSYSVLAHSKGIAIPVCVNCCCFFLFAFHALWKMVMQYQRFRAMWNKVKYWLQSVRLLNATKSNGEREKKNCILSSV